MFKHVVSAVLLIPLANSPVLAQAWATKMFETTQHDFGSLAKGAKAEYEFVFTNIYVGEVSVGSVRSSCSCTSVKVKEPILQTYQKGAVVASINTRAFRGHRSATVTVTFDKPVHAQVQLQVKCNIRGDVVLQPESINLGSIDQGTPGETRLSVGHSGASDWRITDVKSPNPHLSAEVLETARGPGQVSYQLRVRLAEDAPAGYVNDYLALLTNDAQSPQFPVLVEGRVLPKITCSPTSLFLGVLRPGDQVTKQLVLRSKTPFSVTSIRCDGDSLEFNAPYNETPKPFHLIPITFVAGERTGKVSAVIRIAVSGEEVTLPVHAVLTPQPSEVVG
jgi:hypothetical protein